MRALLFGGSGMIGQGVLLECLARPEITKVISVGRTPLEQTSWRAPTSTLSPDSAKVLSR